jgi:hypothetical protein
MYFAIRDDDINFFTKPGEIAANYSHIWDECPISLAVTPFQAGYPKWLFPESSGETPEIFPLGDNRELVEFLRDGCAKARFSIMLHGYNHDIPSGRPEFLCAAGLAAKAREGRAYLENLLGTEVTFFTPPHNALSSEGIDAVVSAGLNIVGIQSFRFGRRSLNPGHIAPFLARNWHLRLLGEEYPRPLSVLDHWEIPYSTLGKTASPESLRNGILCAIRRKGCFCLSMHYWEFGCPMACLPGRTMADVFQELYGLVKNTPGVTFTSVADLPSYFSGRSVRGHAVVCKSLTPSPCR